MKVYFEAPPQTTVGWRESYYRVVMGKDGTKKDIGAFPDGLEPGDDLGEDGFLSVVNVMIDQL